MQKIKQHQAQSGFTIIELLVVIAIIAILAAITIVSYIGITASANTARNSANAQSVKSFAEAYDVDNGSYPGSIDSNSETASARLSGDIRVWYGPAPSSTPGDSYSASLIFYQAYTSHLEGTESTTPDIDSNGEQYVCLGGDRRIDGAKIYYWDYVKSSYVTLDSGDASGVLMERCMK